VLGCFMMLFLVQVFITYGEETKANFRLLRTYGFVTDFNAFEAAVIPVDKHSFTQALEGLPTLQEAVRAMPEVDLARLTLNSEKVQLSKVLAVFRRLVLSQYGLDMIKGNNSAKACEGALEVWAPVAVEGSTLTTLLKVVRLHLAHLEANCGIAHEDGTSIADATSDRLHGCSMDRLSAPLPVQTRFGILFNAGRLSVLKALEESLSTLVLCLMGGLGEDVDDANHKLCSGLMAQLPAEGQACDGLPKLSPTALTLAKLVRRTHQQKWMDRWSSQIKDVHELCKDAEDGKCKDEQRVIGKITRTGVYECPYVNYVSTCRSYPFTEFPPKA